MSNKIFIPFTVDSLSIRRTDNRTVPNNNQNYIYARFDFNGSWHGLNKIAIFSRRNAEAIHVPIIDGMCRFPNSFLTDIGIIEVSIYAGDRRTVNVETVEITQSGYKEGSPEIPPEPGSVYVQSPDSTIPFIRYRDGIFEYFTDDMWKAIPSGGNGAGGSDADRIEALESHVSALNTNVTSLQNEATAKWVLLNAVDNRSRANAADIIALSDRIAQIEAQLGL